MTREDLKNFRYNKLWIEEQIDLYKEMKQRAEGLKAVIIDGMPKAQNKSNYAIESLIDKYDYILNELAKEQEKQIEILMQLRKVENPFRRLLFKYYIQGKTFVKVADEMNYSYDRVKHVHKVALKKFDEAER
jgi:DNA-directed RNA polymerase specialized sigma subunit